MHGTVLLAVFAFCVALALAIAARQPLLAAAALIAGAGWPATILVGGAEPERRADPRHGAPPLRLGGPFPRATCASRSWPWRSWSWRRSSLSTSPRSRGASSSTDGEAGTSRSRAGPRSASGTCGTPTTAGSGSRGADGLSVDRRRRTGGRLLGVRPRSTSSTVAAGRSSSTAAQSRWRATDARMSRAIRSYLRPRAIPTPARRRTSTSRRSVRTNFVGAGVPVAYDTGDKDAQYYTRERCDDARGHPAGRLLHRVELFAQADTAELGRSAPAYPDYLTSLYLTVEGSPCLSTRRPTTTSGCRARSFATRACVPTSRSTRRRAISSERRRIRTRPSSRSRAGSARAATSSTTSGRPCGGGRLRSSRSCGPRRGLLPALRRSDGRDAPHPRDSGPRCGRIHVGPLRRQQRTLDRRRPERAHLGRGVVRRVRLAAVRPDPGRGQLGGSYTASSLRFDLAGFRRAAGAAGQR